MTNAGARDATDSAAGTPLRRELSTPTGPAWADIHLPTGRACAVLAIGHGAGGSVSAPDIVAVSRACLARDVAVVAVTQPYRVAGRRTPPAAARLDEAWLSVLEQVLEDVSLRTRRRAPLPLIAAGRSSGARVACRTAGRAGARAVLALAFPLHPPGRPDRSRQPELDAAGVPVLVVQGSRDPFGMPQADPRLGRQVLVAEGADHGLKRGMGPAADACAEFVRAVCR